MICEIDVGQIQPSGSSRYFFGTRSEQSAARAYDKWNWDRLVIDTAHRKLEVCVDEALDLLLR
ncbi:hypothetical protein ACVJGD_007153 [Bradyrhizobium sp. USDA 10063]